MRNTILASDTSMSGTALQCPRAAVDNSRVETNSSADTWFADIASAEYHLTAAGQTQFVDVAVWQDGDPPFDFDGEGRPSSNGSPDYPGADTIP